MNYILVAKFLSREDNLASCSNYIIFPQGIGVNSKTDCLFILPAAASFVVLSLYILIFLSIPGNYAFSTGITFFSHTAS